ncbi:Extended synaptotagmin-1 [Podila horticola]|nr:Extended synaptotagmin-1 [Podila horticola]
MRFASILATLVAPLVVLASASHHVQPVIKNVPSDNSDTISIMAAKKGMLYIKLNHATNLRNKDWFGKSDPFVEIWLDKSYKQRSKDTKGLSPTFDQTFCFYVRPGQNKLYVRAVDKDTFSNDKIGDASYSLDSVLSTGREGPRDYDLPKWLGLRSNGQLNMQMQFVEDNS